MTDINKRIVAYRRARYMISDARWKVIPLDLAKTLLECFYSDPRSVMLDMLNWRRLATRHTEGRPMYVTTPNEDILIVYATDELAQHFVNLPPRPITRTDWDQWPKIREEAKNHDKQGAQV